MEYKAIYSNDDYISHYGVLGMRWGHRKNPDKNYIRYRPESMARNLGQQAAYDLAGVGGGRYGQKTSKIGKIKSGVKKYGRKGYVERQSKYGHRNKVGGKIAKGVGFAALAASPAVAGASAPVGMALLAAGGLASYGGEITKLIGYRQLNNARAAKNKDEQHFSKNTKLKKYAG